MTCRIIEIKGVGRGIACGRGRALPPACSWCSQPAEFLCDHPIRIQDKGIAKAKVTCDARLCLKHAFEERPKRHLCPTHRLELAAAGPP